MIPSFDCQNFPFYGAIIAAGGKWTNAEESIKMERRSTQGKPMAEPGFEPHLLAIWKIIDSISLTIGTGGWACTEQNVIVWNY